MFFLLLLKDIDKLNINCYECNITMSKDDIDNFITKATWCCSGYHCGCRGEPLEPPLCIKCEVTYMMLEVWYKLELLISDSKDLYK